MYISTSLATCTDHTHFVAEVFSTTVSPMSDFSTPAGQVVYPASGQTAGGNGQAGGGCLVVHPQVYVNASLTEVVSLVTLNSGSKDWVADNVYKREMAISPLLESPDIKATGFLTLTTVVICA
jgi:hypothetical protein